MMKRLMCAAVAVAFALAGCSDDEGAGTSAATDPAGAVSTEGGGNATGNLPPSVALPGNVVAGTPVDDSFPLDVAASAGFGTTTESCRESFVAASGLPATTADCVHVTSALSDWVAVVAGLEGGGNELWMTCSDDAGGYTFGLRWAGTVIGITPMDDATAGSALVVTMTDAAGLAYHVVLWDQYEGTVCPTSTVESAGDHVMGPTVQSGGVLLPLIGDDTVCYRPVDGIWTRGEAEGGAC